MQRQGIEFSKNVHGDIRHLENKLSCRSLGINVHGDIRHLEMSVGQSADW